MISILALSGMDPDSVNPSRHPSYRKSISASTRTYKDSRNIDSIYRDSLALSAQKQKGGSVPNIIYKNSKKISSIYNDSLALSASKSKLPNTNNKPPKYLEIFAKSKSIETIYRNSLALSGKDPDSEIPSKIQKLDNETESSNKNQKSESFAEIDIKEEIEIVTTKNDEVQKTSDEPSEISKDPEN